MPIGECPATLFAHLADDAFEPVEIHAVPGPEEVCAVFAAIPSDLERAGKGGPVNGGLIGPTERVGVGQSLHGFDGFAVGHQDGIVGVHSADITAHQGHGGQRGSALSEGFTDHPDSSSPSTACHYPPTAIL